MQHTLEAQVTRRTALAAAVAVATLGLVLLIIGLDTGDRASATLTSGSPSPDAEAERVVVEPAVKGTLACQHAAEGYRVSVPEGWWVAEIDDAPCKFFHPHALVVPEGSVEWFEPAIAVWSSQYGALTADQFASSFEQADLWEASTDNVLVARWVSDGADGYLAGDNVSVHLVDLGDRAVVISATAGDLSPAEVFDAAGALARSVEATG